MADECNIGYDLKSKYFKQPEESVELKSINSALPNGQAWAAKSITGTIVNLLVKSTSSVTLLLKSFIEYYTKEFNLLTSEDLLTTVWEPSVGLPDSRLPNTDRTICTIRSQVYTKLSKIPLVSLNEIQKHIDTILPESGIWLTTGQIGSQFRYRLRYPFGHFTGNRGRFIIVVNIPKFFIDPADETNSKMTWENLMGWLRSFIPANDMLIPNYLDEDSYCVIKDPQSETTIYLKNDGAVWDIIPVRWMSIDVDETVTHYEDFDPVLPTSESVTRFFTDSTSTLITTTNDIKVVPVPEE